MGDKVRRWAVPAIVLLMAGFTLLLRVWHLNSLPPWLWADEAAQGLNARDLLTGHAQAFFTRGMGQEPLYAYLSAPFVAAWDGQPFAVRIAGALLSALMVPALYVAARALWRDRPHAGVWAGVAAAGFWAANFWPQSMGRIGFQVNALPLILTLAVIFWLSYVQHPTRSRAITFGVTAGLTLATYLAARITPALWIVLYLALPRQKRRSLRPTLLWALLAFVAAVAPLAVHFLLHPSDFIQRTNAFNLLEAGAASAMIREFLQALEQLLGVFLGTAGDPMLRHNVPNRPPFSPYLGALFALGLLFSLVAALRRREQSAITLLLWLAVLCAPFVVSLSNAPHFPRLFGALPAALLLAAWPIGWVADRLRRSGWRAPSIALAAVLALLLIVDGIRTAQAYFGEWAKEPDLDYAYQGEMGTFGEEVARLPGAIGVAPVDPNLSYSLDYLYREVPLFQLPAGEADVGAWLAANLAGGNAAGRQVLTPIWRTGANLMADPRQSLPFYLQREGTLQAETPARGFDLLSFEIGERPQFAAPGQKAVFDAAFSPDLTLREARWGAASPNPDRSGASAAAGTPIWLILSWQLDRPQPDLRIAADLVDGAGHHLESTEGYLMDEQQRAQPSRQSDAAFNTHHLITIPSTQPAGPVTLEVRVYDSRSLEPRLPRQGTRRGSLMLGTATVTPALTSSDGASVLVAAPLEHAFASGVELLGTDALPASIETGQTLPIRLYWRAAKPLSEPAVFSVGLGDTGVSAEARVPQDTPVGQIVHTYVDLRAPPEIPAGDYPLVLAESGPELQGGTAAGAPIVLGQVSVTSRPRQFNAPAIDRTQETTFGNSVRLLGVVGPAEIEAAPGQTIGVTLVWQALSTQQQDLVRFVHMLGPDGRPLAQEDAPPCGGACRAPSWLPGEVLVEQARLTIPDGLAAGEYPLAAGWYDPATLRRLPIADAAELAESRPLGGDPAEGVAILPVKVVVDH